MSADPPSPDDSQALLDRIADEITDRYQRGEKPRLEDYVRRDPDLTTDLERIFDTIAQLRASLDPPVGRVSRNQSGASPENPE